MWGYCYYCGEAIYAPEVGQSMGWTHVNGGYYCNPNDYTSRDYAHPNRTTLDLVRRVLNGQ